MKKALLLFNVLLISQFTIAQSGSLESVIGKIEFQEDTINSVYRWIADNIEYDVSLLKDIESGDASPPKKNIESLDELRKLQLEKVISRKKGVCEDYSVLFNALVSELGYKSFIIEGYIKNEKGKVERRLGHTWNAVCVEGTWKLYDPTWGAGSVLDMRKFVKDYSPEWFDVSPEEMIKTHMPYDPIWQLSMQPINYYNFDKEGAGSSFANNYNFQELIRLYLKKDRGEQMKEQLERSEDLGNGIWLIEKWRKNLRSHIDHYAINNQELSIDEVNAIVEESSELFNDYIKARNKQFKSRKWTLPNSKEVLLKIKDDVSSVITSVKNTEVDDPVLNRSLEKFVIQTERFLKRINEELEYLEKIMK